MLTGKIRALFAERFRLERSEHGIMRLYKCKSRLLRSNTFFVSVRSAGSCVLIKTIKFRNENCIEYGKKKNHSKFERKVH